MQLTFEQICTVTTGAVEIVRETDGIHFYRLTREQMTFSQPQIQNLAQKRISTTGVKLSFRTDSRTLGLRVKMLPGSGRRYYSLDVTANGKFIGALDNFSQLELPKNYAEHSYEPGAEAAEFMLGDGIKDVCIHLPWSFCAVLQELTLDDGAWVEPLIPAKKLLALGDSITQGYDAQRPSNRYIARLAQALDAQEFNKAIGGANTFPELVWAPEAFVPDYIVMAYGTNDWVYSTTPRFCADYRTSLASLRIHYPDTPIFALTPVWRKNADAVCSMGVLLDVEDRIREVAGEFSNVFVISCFHAIPHDEQYYGDLRLHPNDAGFDRYYQAVHKSICDCLESNHA